MQFQRINRTDNDTVYTVGRNVDAASITTGMAAALVLHPASVSRGEQAIMPTRSVVSGERSGVASFHGVAAEDIAANAVGRIIVWGYCASVMISTSISDHTSILPGEYLVPVAFDGTFSSGVAPTILLTGGKIMWNMVTVNVSTAGACGAAWTSGYLKGGL